MKNNVRFFVGPHALTSERIEFLVRDISSRYEDVETKRYYGSEFSPDLFVDEIFEDSLFIKYKIIIVHQIEQIDKKTWTEDILPALKKASENVFIIFEGESVKVKIQDYYVENIEDAENLFKKVFRKSWKKDLSAQDLYEISRFLKMHPYEFAIVVGVIEKHLQNIFLQKSISEQEFLKRLAALSEIDFKLKSGRISSEPGWELLLLSLLDVSS